MYNYLELIEEFIPENFEASTPDEANMKVTTREFLNFLFQTFPRDCISEYELSQTFERLGFKRILWSREIPDDSYDKKEIRYELVNCWCLYAKALKPNQTIVLQNQWE